MKIVQVLNSQFNRKSVVTIGTFDGVHIGHQKIIRRLVKLAHKKDMQAVVLTFFPHPRRVLQKGIDLKMINTLEEKKALLDGLGVDQLVVQEFTKEFSRLTALEFVRDFLINKLNTKYIIIGYDHRFGRNREANIDDLKEYGETYNFEVIEISAQEVDDVAVSSTKIRRALDEGEISKANAYLGYKFMITGTVVKGKGLGKQIAFPTANIQIDEDYKLIPKDGAYVVRSRYEGKTIFGMMNIGMNPTISDQKKRSLEVHFFNFGKPLYGEKLQIELLDRLRDEQKFDSLQVLKKQLAKDKAMALDLINNRDD